MSSAACPSAGATPLARCGPTKSDPAQREGSDEKAAVAAKIRGFRCGYGKPRTAALADGIVDYRNNHEESNFSDWAKPWLMRNL